MQRISEKSRLLALVLVLLAGVAVRPATAAPFSEGAAASDVIVLLDTSQSVLPYFRDVTDYVVSSVVKDFLRMGDTFHLLSFGDTAQVEIAQRVTSEADVRSILARLYLLYPLARSTDIVSAFSYLYQYLADLPESRAKVVVVITDGVSNPQAGSPEAALSSDETKARVTDVADRLRSRGWPVYVIKVPFSADRAAAESQGAAKAAGSSTQATAPGPGGDAAGGMEKAGSELLGAVSGTLGTPLTDYNAEGKDGVARKSLSLPLAVFPADLGRRGYTFSFPLSIRNDGDEPVALELSHVVTDGMDILQKKSFLNLAAGKTETMDVKVALPSTMELGPKHLSVELYFADGIRVSPSRGVLSFELAPSPLARFLGSGSRVVLFVVLLALGLGLVLALVLYLGRRAPRQSAGPVVKAVRESAEEAAEARRIASSAANDAKPAAGVAIIAANQAGASPGTKAPQAAPSEARGLPASTAFPGGAPASGGSSLPAARPAAALSLASVSTRPEEVAPRAGAAADREGLPLRKKPAELASQREDKPVSASGYVAKVVKPGNLEVELRVEGQNHAIGMRNVLKLGAGSSKTVGGGRSDFLVFVSTLPAHAAELHYDGESCVFVPRRPEFFPELSGPVADCLHKDIPAMSRSGHRLVLRFHRYVSPKDRINRLLHCIESPGLYVQSED